MNIRKYMLLGLAFSAAATGCVTRSDVFLDQPALTVRDDRKSGPLPAKTDYDFVEDAVHSTTRIPVNEYLDFRRTPRSLDVNSLDELPASTWFTPRLGYQELSPEELLKGPEVTGPPALPVTVVKAKSGGNSPGFVIRDARGQKYLVKFDADDFPGAQSTANLVTNRLFWAFGYNVPEDYVFLFKSSDLAYELKDEKGQQDAEFIMLTQTPDKDGYYRATASLYISGDILGPTAQIGTRKGDINDTIPHEDLRILRALKVFGALVDHTGMRSDNSLDVFVNENGKQYTKHYLLDFGETLGVHGLEKRRNWDGHEHFFSLKDSTLKYLSLGIPVQSWEDLENNPSDYALAYHDKNFVPSEWKETWQFQPIRQSQPDDDYWAAKIIAALNETHLRKLFDAAGNPNRDYSEALLKTLMNRRQAILNEVMERVTPLEFSSITGSTLNLKDFRSGTVPGFTGESYSVVIRNQKGRKVHTATVSSSADGMLQIPVGDLTNGYFSVSVSPLNSNASQTRPAEFHIRTEAGNPRVLGILH